MFRRKVIAPMTVATPRFRCCPFARFAVSATLGFQCLLSSAFGQGLVAEPTRLDLGAGHVSETLSGSLQLRNTLSEPIRLYSVEPNCETCTYVTFTNGWIEPGEASEVAVSLSANSEHEEHLVQTITIRCSDRERPQFKVVVEGRFQPILVIPQSKIDLGPVRAGTVVEVPCAIWNWGSEDVEVQPFCSTNITTIQSISTTGGPTRTILRFPLHIPDSAGPLSKEIVWHTSAPEQPEVRIVVTGIATEATMQWQSGWVYFGGSLSLPLMFLASEWLEPHDMFPGDRHRSAGSSHIPEALEAVFPKPECSNDRGVR